MIPNDMTLKSFPVTIITIKYKVDHLFGIGLELEYSHVKCFIKFYFTWCYCCTIITLTKILKISRRNPTMSALVTRNNTFKQVTHITLIQ